ncbi:MAG: PEP-CTERM sorting domain-containing protein [Phycisphaerales bacterium]|nr:PEP-CTERM sorting domain-containing protein [Phycisphaerales bacterium]
MSWKVALAVTLVVAAGTAAASAGSPNLLIPETSDDTVMLFNGFDGSLINPTFIVDTDILPFGASSPRNAVVAGNEIWFNDNSRDAVYRFSLDGTTFLGAIDTGLDDTRSLTVVGSTVYVSNDGTSNGAPGDNTVVTIDIPTASITGSFATNGEIEDILSFNGGLLINDIDNDNLDLYDLNGNFLSTFHDSPGTFNSGFIRDPQQMTLSSNGILAVSDSFPSGIFEYDLAGNQTNFWLTAAVGNPRGVHELGNGNIIFTSASGVHILDPNNGQITTSHGGVSARYIEPIPEPSSLLLLGLAGGLVTLRRRSR